MTGTEGTPEKNQLLAGVAFTAVKVFALVGIFTLVAIALAIIAGLWLDARLDTKPLFTVIFVLASVPVSFLVTLRVTMAQVNQMQSARSEKRIKQPSEGDNGTN